MTSINYNDEDYDPSMEYYIGGILAAICNVETNPYDSVINGDAKDEWDQGNIDTVVLLNWPTPYAHS